MRLRDIALQKNILDYSYGNDELQVSIEGRRYKTHSDYLSGPPTILLGQAFGSGIDSSDKYNQNIRLAQGIKDIRTHWDEEIPAIVQTHVGYFLKDQEKIYSVGGTYEDKKLKPLILDPDKHSNKKNLNTKEVLEQSLEIAYGLGLDVDKGVFLCHPAMGLRALELGKKLGVDGKIFTPMPKQWPKNDSQGHVQGPLKWWLFENAARIHHWKNGWVKREI